MSALHLAEPTDATHDSRRVTRSRSRMHAAASSDASSSVPSTRSGVCGFSGLASVEVHLVMQCLDPSSLARLACTCRLLRAEALHPSAGRFLATCPAVRKQYYADSVSLAPRAEGPALRSPLGRAHLHATLLASPTLDRHGPSPELEPPHSVFVVRLMDKAAGWKQVRALDLEEADWWAERDALMLLSSPALQRVSSVLNVDGVWLSEPVLSALCRLPLLTSLAIQRFLSIHNHPAFRLHPSALRHATALRSLFVGRCNLPVMLLAGLACPLPQLTQLSLSSDHRRDDDAQPCPGLFAWLTLNCRPMLSRLRQLRLPNLDLSEVPPAELRRFCRALPGLRFLSTMHWHPNCILRALADAGPRSLPELRCVRFWQDHSGDSGGGGSLSREELDAFLQRFPAVRYCLTICGDGDEYTNTRDEFADWDRVCTVRSHAEPNDDGICADCTGDDSDEEHEEEPDSHSDDEQGDDHQGDEEQGDSDQCDDDPADDGSDSDHSDGAEAVAEAPSLEQTERDYAIAIQAAAPWVEPSIGRSR